MDRLFGLPAHPLVVHVPVVLLPLAVIGVFVTLFKTAWYERYKWAVLAVGAIGTLGAIIAAGSGEALERDIRKVKGRDAVRAVHDHVEAGNLARTGAIVFLVALAGYVLVPWLMIRREIKRPSWLRPVLIAAVSLTAVFSLITIVNAGHSGASRAWDDYKDIASTN